MSTVDISDLHLPSLIQALWCNMKPATFFSASGVTFPSSPSMDDISSALSRSKYIDYLAGRCIKSDFSDLTTVNTALYNRNAG